MSHKIHKMEGTISPKKQIFIFARTF